MTLPVTTPASTSTAPTAPDDPRPSSMPFFLREVVQERSTKGVPKGSSRLLNGRTGGQTWNVKIRGRFAQSPAAAAAEPPLSPVKKVLIADDSPLVLRMLENAAGGGGARGGDGPGRAGGPREGLRRGREPGHPRRHHAPDERLPGLPAPEDGAPDPGSARHHPDQPRPGGGPLLGTRDRGRLLHHQGRGAPRASWSWSRTSWPYDRRGAPEAGRPRDPPASTSCPGSTSCWTASSTRPRSSREIGRVARSLVHFDETFTSVMGLVARVVDFTVGGMAFVEEDDVEVAPDPASAGHGRGGGRGQGPPAGGGGGRAPRADPSAGARPASSTRAARPAGAPRSRPSTASPRFPITTNGRLTGLLALGGSAADRLDADTDAFLAQVANQAHIVVENSRLFERAAQPRPSATA